MGVVGTQVLGTEQRQDAASQKIAAICVIGVAILGGVGFRWFDLARWSLWWDEGYTAWASGLTPVNLARFARSDDHPPLYYLSQHYWVRLFGNSEFALRALSAFLGCAAFLVFYLLAKKILKDRMAVALSMWLFAFSLRQVWYSREARAYEAASFFALVALYALIRFLETRSAWAFVTVVICSSITLYMHSVMFFYLFALNVTWMAYPSERSFGQRLKELLVADVFIGILYLPWALTLLTQVGAISKDLWWLPRPTLLSVVRTLRDTAGFDIRYLVTFAHKHLPFTFSESVLWYVLSVGAVLLSGALFAAFFWQASKKEKTRFLALLSYCVLPILVIFVLGQKMPLYIDRVFTASSIVVPILFAYPLAVQRSSKGRLQCGSLSVVLAIATILSSFGFVRWDERLAKSNEDWRGVALKLVGITESNRLIVFAPPPSEMLFDYYCRQFSCPAIETVALPMSFYDEFPPPKSKPIGPNDIKPLESALDSKNYSEVDLVSAHNIDPQGLISSYLSRDFRPQENTEIQGSSVQVVRFLAARALKPDGGN